MRVRPARLVRFAVLAAVLGAGLGATSAPPPVHAAPGATTAHQLRKEVTRLADRAAKQWAGMMTPSGVFRNPWPLDAALGHGSFVPPGLAYGVHASGLRRDDPQRIAAAERAWPNAVAPERASAFDMLAAAYALRHLTLTDPRRAQIADYLSRYGIPLNGGLCIADPGCYNNLKLVDATAVLAITGLGIRAADPAARLADPVAARAAAAEIVNKRVARVADFSLRTVEAGARRSGTVLSDPPADPLAYHALSAFMLDIAVRELGPEASEPARRARAATLEALAVFLAPDGDVSWLGRGQAQVWVPALAAAALAAGARAHPARAPRYLGAARLALRRLQRLHATRDRGFDVVPGVPGRTTTNGIDPYVHTVAYNGLTLLGLGVARDSLADVPRRTPVRKPPATRRLRVADPEGTGLGIVANRRVWLGVHAFRRNTSDLRHDFGLLALKRRTPGGAWRDMIAARPRTDASLESAGPALVHHGLPISPVGRAFEVRRDEVEVEADYRVGRKLIRRVTMTWSLGRRGARLALEGAKRGDVFRLLAWTPAGTGRGRPDGMDAAGTRWRFDRPVVARRFPGYSSAPEEQLDALEALVVTPKSEGFRVAYGIPVG